MGVRIQILLFYHDLAHGRKPMYATGIGQQPAFRMILCHRMESLAAELQRRKVDRLFEDAQYVRDFPSRSERLLAAGRLISEANIALALGTLTEEQRERLMKILDFAIPPPEHFLRREGETSTHRHQ